MSEDLVTWLRTQVEARMSLARHAIESEACAAEWSELTSGVLVTGPPSHDDTWEGTHAIGDSRIVRLMEANDPRDTIARCEAELAILDEHEPNRPAKSAPGYARGQWCESCNGEHPCRTVRLIGHGHRHRPGYKEEWKP